jgi:hypothetical protein
MSKYFSKRLIVGGVLLGCFAMSGMASARCFVAPDCSKGRDPAQFTTGLRLGKQLSDLAAVSAGLAERTSDGQVVLLNPDQFEEYQGAILAALDVSPLFPPSRRGPQVTNALRCRAQGEIDALFDQLDRWQNEAALECLVEGSNWGEFSADLYCGILESIDSPTPDTGLVALPRVDREPGEAGAVCEEFFEQSCDTLFDATATQREECVPFTTGEFRAEYDATIGQSCDY